MPIFEYHCPKHGLFEILENIDKKCNKCPICGAKCNKIVSLPATPQFKGGGFYETDYKRKEIK